MKVPLKQNCVVPENMYTPPHRRSLEIQRGRGSQRLKFPKIGEGSSLTFFPEGGKKIVTNEIYLHKLLHVQ